jgi:hypothetical protein
MADYIKRCYNRDFEESEYYNIIYRIPIGIAKNNVWCYTVEKSIEKPRIPPKRPKPDKIVIRLIRWKARNDEKSPEIKYWRHPRAYNVRSINEWENAKSVIDALMSKELINPEIVTLPLDNYKDLLRIKDEKNKLESEIENIRSLNQVASTENKVFRKRINLMKKEKGKYEKILDQLSRLVNNPKTLETKIQSFFQEKKPVWLFGLEYRDLIPKVKFPKDKPEFECDFMLLRYDNFLDLVELKGPNEKLFRPKNNRYIPYKKLSEAIGQVFMYIYICDANQFMNFFRPKSYIIIGNKTTDNPNERHLFSSFLNNVEIYTYTELLTRGETLLSYIDTIGN